MTPSTQDHLNGNRGKQVHYIHDRASGRRYTLTLTVLLASVFGLIASPSRTAARPATALRVSASPRDQALLQAARLGDDTQVRALLTKDAHMDAQDAAGQTPLMLAADHGHMAVVRLLLAHRANAFLKRKDSQTALSLAIRSDHTAIAEAVAAAQSQPEVAEYQPGTPLLSWAALFGDMAAVRALVARGADLNGAEGAEALASASVFGQTEAIRYLLAHGANINAPLGHGMTVLMMAASSPRPGQGSLLTLLINKGANINAENADGKTALLYAATSGNLETVEVLVARGADVAHSDKKGETASSLGSKSGATEREAILALLQRAASHTQEQGHREELVITVGRGDLAATQGLLAQGGDVNARDDEGDTLLMVAAKQGSLSVVQLLLKSGADVELRSLDYWHYTALARAAEAGHADVVEALLEAGADPNAKIAQGYTALTRATMAACIMVVGTKMIGDPASPRHAALVAQSLLRHGANPNGVDDDGETELDQAAALGVTPVAAVLLDHGAKINAGAGGGTALRWAVSNGWPETVKLLVARGANVNMLDGDGKRPLTVAYEKSVNQNAEGTREYASIIATLKAAGARK